MDLSYANRIRMERPQPFLGDPESPPTNALAVAMPKLDSAFVNGDLTTQIPWYLLVINLWRLAQPTGVTPGTYMGITVNAYGQVTDAQTSGVIINSPVVNNPTITNPTVSGGTFTSPTINGPTVNNGTWNNPTLNNGTWNTPTLNNGAWNTATINGVSITGSATAPTAATPDNSTTISTTAFVKNQGYIPDAPIDGLRYARQNGVWVAF